MPRTGCRVARSSETARCEQRERGRGREQLWNTEDSASLFAPYARIPKVLTYAKTNCLCVWDPVPSHTPPFSSPPASCARRVAGLTRIIFTAYHRLNIDLRMVSSSVCERPPVLLLSSSLSPFPLSLSRLAPRFRVRLIFWHREFDDTDLQR